MKYFLFLLILSSCLQLSSQEKKHTDLKLFLDCEKCDEAYIKQNLTYVDFVRDQKFADVHILFRIQPNGGGGKKYEIDFIGQGRYKKNRNWLNFSTKNDDTHVEVRDMIFEYIKLGLVKFWIRSGNDDVITINLKEEDEDESEIEESDTWNKWTFNIGFRGSFSGQEVKESQFFNYNVSAKRVTEKNKFFFRVSKNNDKKTFRKTNDTIVTHQKSSSVRISNVFSLNDHWSAGIFGGVYKSTYNNYDFAAYLKPAIEYNFFTYKESSKRQLVLSYRIGAKQNEYIETTIFGEDSELLFEHELNLGGSVLQKWGNISSELSYEHFLHDAKLSALAFRLGTNFRVFKGLSLSVNGIYKITDNQVNLAAGDISLEDLLLAQKQAKSGYNYSLRMGLNYSFGSMYNSIVNPRFNF